MRIKIPANLERFLDSICNIECSSYDAFCEFIYKSENLYSTEEFGVDLGRRNSLKERRVKFYDKDYKKIVEIARKNGLTKSLVIEIALKNFLKDYIPRILGENVLSQKITEKG